MISVAELMSDPDLVQTITRTQRVQTINAYGEVAVTSTSTSILAVVTSPGKTGLMRLEDAQTYQDTIRVVTSSPLNAGVVGQQPDLIVWNGQTYIVVLTNDYQAFGFTDAVCKLTDYQDQPNV